MRSGIGLNANNLQTLEEFLLQWQNMVYTQWICKFIDSISTAISSVIQTNFYFSQTNTANTTKLIQRRRILLF